MTLPDHFRRLGLPRRFAVDAGELERAYLARSRAAHPDYHLAGSAADLNASLELSAALNEAYTTLRDPFARAEHLLALDGGPSAADHKQMPPAFLAEMLDAREEIEAARGKSDEAERLRRTFTARFDATMAEVATLLDEEPRRKDALPRVRGLLNAAKYVRGLVRDLDAE